MKRVALATCAEIPEGDEDAPGLIEALARVGVAAESKIWDDPKVPWSSFDLVLVRSTWDYAARRDELLEWLERTSSVTRAVNSLEVIRWNTDKRYLSELDQAGVEVVPTRFLSPSDPLDLGFAGELVVKPAISAGSRDTARFGADAHDEARALAARLQAAGRTVMVQPYLPEVDSRGETAMVYLGGRFSHAARKGPLLRPGASPTQALFAPEDMAPREPSSEELELAERCAQALPFALSDLLYARFDLIPDEDLRPRVLEVELTEPSLFLGLSEGAFDRFASSIARACV